ncbi:Uu.00g017710.m01.CDS01 [Anthostomella pinea]|uniref:Uu.00g017710.m01.CDS01 n=1 Tax=Anthostomella pinea TaxID=933095 RepID=A0AAI8YNE4_9PEZI|nr:Uu.00g017710.m01.CDS01 [Anthostomella pinea]
MTTLAKDLPNLQLSLGVDDLANLAVTPWFSYIVNLVECPLPTIPERPHLKTERLILRPILPSDLDAFCELRKIPECQNQSKTRGRADESREETKQALEALNREEQNHWYFGVFLQATGELIGEAGLPDCVATATSNTGWPEAEFLLKPRFWRQGYGTEAFNALVDSWWGLPRERRRHQLITPLVPGIEPGAEVPEGLVFQWEAHNVRASGFFAKVLAQAPAAAEGTFESRDMRDGRQGEIVRWAGTLIGNPRS